VATNLEPREVQAILDLTRTADGTRPAEVATRDFERPLRLSPDEIEAARIKLRRALPGLEAELARSLRKTHPLELVDLGEVTAEGLFRELEPPLAVLCFEVDGQPGWVVWDPLAALMAVEIVLGGSEPTSTEARPLTTVERGVITRILSGVARNLGRALGVEPSQFRAPELKDDLGGWHDGGRNADRRRLHLHFAFQGPGGASEMRVYMPGVDPAEAASSPPAPALPSHLGRVCVSVVARLGHSDIPLSDLLSLEPGDVIPLRATTDEPLWLDVEDLPSALGVLGSKNGNLAVRVTEVGVSEARE
jgi:flagellar motor switch protein FliM